MSEERTEAIASLCTSIDCPLCGDTFYVEGDATGEDIDCPVCNALLTVGHV